MLDQGFPPPARCRELVGGTLHRLSGGGSSRGLPPPAGEAAQRPTRPGAADTPFCGKPRCRLAACHQTRAQADVCAKLPRLAPVCHETGHRVGGGVASARSRACPTEPCDVDRARGPAGRARPSGPFERRDRRPAGDLGPHRRDPAGSRDAQARGPGPARPVSRQARAPPRLPASCRVPTVAAGPRSGYQ
jgi:hypothetical protein